jgi:transposase
MKKVFIGIDFSKKTFDVSLIEGNRPENVLAYEQFENTKEGCIQPVKFVELHASCAAEEWLFCGEHTGIYSILASSYPVKKGLFLWLENPLQVKTSLGIRRDKSDKSDSRDIALYAYRNQDRARAYQLPEKRLSALKSLLSFRGRLLSSKHALLVSAKEIRSILQHDSTVRHIYEQSKKIVESINKEIKRIEKEMLELINTSETLKENYRPVSSIKGIALLNTVAILVATENFTRFENSRQFACFSGMAPFGKQSGSSLKTKPHVSRLADRQIKVLLTQAAKSAIRHDANLKRYYERKVAEGKNEWAVINNVRNKLIHRIFAIVKSRRLYQVDYCNPLQRTTA